MECTGIKIDIWLVYMLLYKAEDPEVKKINILLIWFLNIFKITNSKLS